MANYITVDGGTTNTRVSLVCDRQIRATKKLKIGAGSDDPAGLKQALKAAIAALLSENNLQEQEIVRILASGMITSEKGLCDLPHCPLPAGLGELHAARQECLLADVSSIPFVFLRGVKKCGDTLEEVDLMRGEETELMGLLGQGHEGGLYVLPGSHAKHIQVDAAGRITDFQTMLTGEWLAAVAQHTILRYAVDFAHSELCEDELLQGYHYARKRGVGEALFKTRVLKNSFGATPEQCYSFLLGCVLCDEVEAILRAGEDTVVLGGQKNFRSALALLLERVSEKKPIVLSDGDVEASTALGAVRIYEYPRKA